MIHIQQDFDSSPEILQSPGCQKLIQKSLLSHKKIDSSIRYYRDEPVLDRLQTTFHYKCAYCEVLSSGGFHIDHFRPQSPVKELTKEKHQGYYWLSCEWSNLIFSCNACNQKKSNQFPIKDESFRVSEPENPEEWRADSKTFERESALLIHPQIDKPEKHFNFLPNGAIKVLTKKGAITQKICGLNRKELVRRRIKSIKEIINRIDEESSLFAKKEHNKMELRAGLRSVFASLFSKMLPENEFSRLYYFFVMEFDAFISRYIPGKKRQQFIKDAFNKYKKTNKSITGIKKII